MSTEGRQAGAPRATTPGKNGVTATVQPAARAREAEAEDESAPWEQLASADTADPTARVDTAPRSGKKVARRSSAAVRKSAAEPGKQKKTARSSRNKLWLIVAVVLGVLLLAGGGVVAYVLLFGQKTTEERPPLVVSRSRKDAFPTVNAALGKARPGDRIVLAEDEIKEPLVLRDGKTGWDVTIEPEENRKVTWSLPDNARPDDHFVWLTNAQRLRLKKIIFDGRGKAEEIVLLTGKCPGLTLDECQFQGFKKCAVLVNNCEGDPSLPVTLSRLETVVPVAPQPAAEAALIFDVNDKVVFPKSNQYILVRDCRFVGSYKAPIQKLRGELTLDPQSTNNQVFPNGVNNPGVAVQIPK
jgi:hypothetical protein